MVFCIDQFANVPNAFPNRLNKHTRFGELKMSVFSGCF